METHLEQDETEIETETETQRKKNLKMYFQSFLFYFKIRNTTNFN